MTTKKPSGLDAIEAQKEKTARRRGQFPTDRARPRTTAVVLPEIPDETPRPRTETAVASATAATGALRTPKRWKLSGSRSQIAVGLRWRADLHALLGEIVAGLELDLGVKTSRRELIEAYVVPGLDGASSEDIATRVADYRRGLAREIADASSEQ